MLFKNKKHVFKMMYQQPLIKKKKKKLVNEAYLSFFFNAFPFHEKFYLWKKKIYVKILYIPRPIP